MHAGHFAHSLVSAPDLFSASAEEGLLSISRAVNPRFRGVSAEDALGHRSQLSLRQRKDLMEQHRVGGHTVVAKRNARERTRVHTVNKAFHILKQRLPALRIHSKRVSKLRILKAAIVYINNLRDTIDAARDSARRNNISSDFHFTLDAPLITSSAPAPVPPKNTALHTALPYIKSFIDYAPYMPQAVAPLGTSTASGTAPASIASVAPSIEFASILSTAAASIGYSNAAWSAYT